jgi:hypothetical protein
VSYQATGVVASLPYRSCGPLAYRVLVKLADVAQPDGRSAYRFAPHMASELDVSVRSIQRATSELEEAGLIRRGDQKLVTAWRGGNRPIVYDVNMHGTTTILPFDVDDEEAFKDDPVLLQCPHNGGKPHRFDPQYHYCSCGVKKPGY